MMELSMAGRRYRVRLHPDALEKAKSIPKWFIQADGHLAFVTQDLGNSKVRIRVREKGNKFVDRGWISRRLFKANAEPAPLNLWGRSNPVK